MLNWFAERWNAFITWGLSLLLSVWDMLNDLICFTLDVIFHVVISTFSSLGGVLTSFGISGYLDMLPDSMLNVMAVSGVDQVSAIIVSAVIIRFTMQLIPFVRLGS